MMGVVRSAWDAVAPEVQQRRARALAPRRSSSAAAFQTPTPRGFRASYRAGYGLGTTIAGLHATRERAWRRTARAVPPESASLLEKAAHLPTPRTPPARCAHPFAAARGCAPASRRPRHWRPPGTCWRRAAPRVGAAIGAPRTRRAARVRARAARGRPPRPPSPGTRCCAAQHGRGGWGGAAAGARRGGPSAQGRESRARAWTSYYSYFEVHTRQPDAFSLLLLSSARRAVARQELISPAYQSAEASIRTMGFRLAGNVASGEQPGRAYSWQSRGGEVGSAPPGRRGAATRDRIDTGRRAS